MTQIDRHPLLRQAYDVCIAIEECGASVELTNAVTKASALLMALDKFIPLDQHSAEDAFQHFLSYSGSHELPEDVRLKMWAAFQAAYQ
jgi:hypothetical protein